jgi:hypothetical protein
MSTVQTPEQVQAEWLERLNRLIDDVKTWAEELDWSTRRIEIKLEESRIGKYQAPALLLQQEAIRILLQPIASSAPGTQGVVDLYLMPAYDDIASVYYYDGNWHVHYMFPGTPSVGDIHDAPAKLLSKETLSEVLGEMKKNA